MSANLDWVDTRRSVPVEVLDVLLEYHARRRDRVPMSIEQIAELTGTEREQIKKISNRAMRKLRQRLAWRLQSDKRLRATFEELCECDAEVGGWLQAMQASLENKG